jgi:hypothetical protein
MTVISKDEILVALPSLNRAELEAVQATAGHLLGGRVSGAPNGATTAPQVLFDALAATVARPIPYSMLPANLTKQYEAHFPSLVIFFDRYFKGWDSNRTTQTGFLRMIFSLMAADLKVRKVAPSVQALIYSMPRIYEIVDSAFPEYLENDKGHMNLKMFLRRSA